MGSRRPDSASRGRSLRCDPEAAIGAPLKDAHLSGSSKTHVFLPNGVKLTTEYGELEASKAIIGALGRVQALQCLTKR